MNKSECLEILDRFEDWNYGQMSVSLIFRGIRTKEDDIYDARRNLILMATQKLQMYVGDIL